MKNLILLFIAMVFASCTPVPVEQPTSGSLSNAFSSNEVSRIINRSQINENLAQLNQSSDGQVEFVIGAQSDPSNKDQFWHMGEILLDGKYEVTIPAQLSIRGLFKSEALYMGFDNLYCSYEYLKQEKVFELESCFLKDGDIEEYYSSNKYIVSEKIFIHIEESGDQVSDADIEAIVVAEAIVENDEDLNFPVVVEEDVSDEVSNEVSDEQVEVVVDEEVVVVDVPEENDVSDEVVVEEDDAEVEVVDSDDQDEVLEQVDSAKEGCQPDREHSLRKCLKTLPSYKLIKFLAKGYLHACRLQDKKYSSDEVDRIHKHFSPMILSYHDRCRLNELPYYVIDKIMHHCRHRKFRKHRHHKKFRKLKKRIKRRRKHHHSHHAGWWF
jgi:hypothetical protein